MLASTGVGTPVVPISACPSPGVLTEGDQVQAPLHAPTARSRSKIHDPWIFGEDKQPPSPDKIGWWWKRTRKLAQIDPKWRLDDLRHWRQLMPSPADTTFARSPLVSATATRLRP